MYKISTILLLIFSLNGFTQVEEVEEKLSKKLSQEEILSKLRALKGDDIAKFLTQMDFINKLSSTYIKEKEEECSGYYSTIITNESGKQIVQKKKLTKKEKNNCKYLLINFQIQFTRIAYELRKKYLLNLQKKQLTQLEELKNKRLVDLETIAQKYK